MEKTKRILEKIFNIRNFLLLVFGVAAVCMIIIKQKSDAIQKMSDNRIVEFSMDSYVIGESVSVSNALKESDITGDNVDAIVIGSSSDGGDIIRYYVTDKEIIDEVYKKLFTMEVFQMNDPADDFVETEEVWDIHLYPTDCKYAFRIYGQATDDKNYYRTVIETVDRKAYFSKSKYWHQDLWSVFGSEYQLVYKSNINEFIGDIIKEYERNISEDEVVNLYTEEMIDYGTLFSYAHGECEEGEAPIYEDYPEFTLPTNIFKFPIEGTKTYVYLEVQYANSINNESKIKVIDLSLYNEVGEYINLMIASENDIRAFCK